MSGTNHATVSISRAAYDQIAAAAKARGITIAELVRRARGRDRARARRRRAVPGASAPDLQAPARGARQPEGRVKCHVCNARGKMPCTDGDVVLAQYHAARVRAEAAVRVDYAAEAVRLRQAAKAGRPC